MLVKNPSGYQFSVVGKVKSPGTFTPGRYVNALEALGIAGGPTEFAQTGRIRIIRKVGQRLQTIPVELGGALKGDLDRLSAGKFRRSRAAIRWWCHDRASASSGASPRAAWAAALLVSGGAAEAKTTTYVISRRGSAFRPTRCCVSTANRALRPRLCLRRAFLGIGTRHDDADRLYREHQLSARLWLEADLPARRPHQPERQSDGYRVRRPRLRRRLRGPAFQPPVRRSDQPVVVPGQPVVVPTNPLPPPNFNPDVFGFNGRQYRLNGSVGASIRSGARATISASAPARSAPGSPAATAMPTTIAISQASDIHGRFPSGRRPASIFRSSTRISATATRPTSSIRPPPCTAS